MSRIGKKPIAIPAKTEVTVVGSTVTVKGPLGELSRVFASGVSCVVADGAVTLTPGAHMTNPALWGTVSSHVKNMIAGVNKAYEKKLIIEGIGYKAEVKGSDLVMGLGFSHPVKLAIPAGLKVTTEKNIITISGIDKEKVGQFVAEIRAWKKPEPYKGKGIRYIDEVVRRKQGKKAA